MSHPQPPPPASEWRGGDAPGLIDHLLTAYHLPLRETLARLVELAEVVAHGHGVTHPALGTVRSEVLALDEELAEHMAKEEEVLFPMMIAGQAGLAFGPIPVMRAEHDDALAALSRLERLTDGYAPPLAADDAWVALYTWLAAMDGELRRHIALEEDLLFPMAAG